MKRNFMGFALAVAVLALPRMPAAAGPAPVDLRSAAHFTILAGAAITSTGGGIIGGDVGASPVTGGAIGLTTAQVHGAIYAVDAGGPAGAVVDPALLTVAKADLTTAYNDARDRTPVPEGAFLNPGDGNIGGMNLVPGLYKFTTTASITGGNLTLTGGKDDVWIFQVGTTLAVGSGVRVILAGGAQVRNIFWQVGSSATLGTFSDFKGTILAAQSVTMGTSSTMDGRALAFTAGVTFNGALLAIPSPTQVQLVAFGADSSGGVVRVSWQTALEDCTAGFTVYRYAGAAWVEVASVAAQGVDGQGAAYTVEDAGARPGGFYNYRLVEQDCAGDHVYGPWLLEAGAFRLEMPVRPTPEGMVIRWLSRSGEVYRLLRTTNLIDGQWSLLNGGIPATESLTTCTDTSNGLPVAYYRVEIE